MILTDTRASDWVAAWKAASIIITGIFGILGLATEFKHPQTRKVTRWGKVALGGIVLSTAFGTAAQLKQSADDSAKALAMLDSITRSLSPLNDPRLSIHLSLDCTVKAYKEFCREASHDGPTPKDIWKKFPGGAHMNIGYGAIIDPNNPDNYLPLPEGSLEYEAGERWHGARGRYSTYYEGFTKAVEIWINDDEPYILRNDGNLTSLRDLIDKPAEIYVQIPANPTDFRITIKSGEQVGCKQFTYVSKSESGVSTYSCTLKHTVKNEG